MAEGKIVYHGPRGHVLEFFDECGFRCPERKGVADFLQEVISRKDQAQYWYRTEQPYSHVSTDMFSTKFKASPFGKKLEEELSEPYDKTQSHENALSFSVYSLSKWELFSACMSREFLLMRRNSFIYVFKTTQLVIIAFITMTVFLRTRMAVDVVDSTYYMGALFYALIILLADGFPELSMTVARLAVFYKQKELYFYPAWAYAIPATILKVPLSLVESLVWTCLTYYVIGYSPEVGRFFCHFILLFAVHLTSVSMFRFLASFFQTVAASTTAGSLSILLVLLFSGFIIPHPSMPVWLKWGFWVSPLTYGEIAISVNEFLAPRWQKILSTNTTIGREILEKRGLNYDGYFYWISLGALFGFTIIFVIGFTLALSFLKPPGRSRAIISHEKLSQIQASTNSSNGVHVEEKHRNSPPKTIMESDKGRMVLPFEPLTVTFQNVQYYIDTPLAILLKTGGRIIYSGPLGQHSSRVIEYFEGISGVPQIRTNYNPATWMLEVTSTSSEAELGVNFAQIYRDSALYENNEELVNQLSTPPPGSRDLHFPTRFSQDGWGQFKSCLWKQHLSYWRSPSYNLMRFMHMLMSSLLFGLLFWKHGRKINNQQDVFNVFGSMFVAVIFLGINNCANVLPYVAAERTVLCRERFSGMYSSWAYSIAQVTIEVPYLFTQTVMFFIITYPMIGYYWSAYKVVWYFYAILCTLMYFNYLGMLLVSLTPNVQVAAIISSAFYTMLNLFAGFLIPKPRIPKWWIWLYYLCPTSWSLNGLLTSQYGDIDKNITVFGETKTVAAFLKDYYGYHHDQLPIVAVLLIVFPFIFASLFAFFIGRLNFQRR
ncbi:hypothetical protein L1049_019818 [Liquidambar formosana]|uniref:Uncharacterized protein n=1 Tax=Liquidambar formosana TaxID=63359 RepID=A0AAP0S8T7_LIQFO